MAATRRASKFVYEIQAEYSGERDLRRLQDDLTALSRIEAWQGAADRYRQLNQQLRDARNHVAALQQQFAASGGTDSALARQLQNAQRDVIALERAVQRQHGTLTQAQADMQALGIGVLQAAQRYQQLQTAAQTAGRALAARNTLGVRSDSDIRAEMDALRKAYRDLATSGTASTRELQRAAENLRGRLRELRTELQGAGKLDLARANLGIRSDAAIRAQMDALKQSYRDLATSGRASLDELRRAGDSLRRQLGELRREMQGQGVNRVADARSLLGLRGDAEIRAEIERVKAAYRTLEQSGTASTNELRRAAQRLADQLKALRAEMQAQSPTQSIRNILGIRSNLEITGEIEGLKRLYRDLARSGVASQEELARAAEAVRRRIRELRQEMNSGNRVDLARQVLGIRGDQEITAQINRIRRAYQDLARSGTASAAELRRAHEAMNRQISALQGEARGLTATATQMNSLKGALAGFAAAFGVGQLTQYAKSMFQLADEYGVLDAKIKLATASEREAAQVRKQLYDLSQQTGTSYQSNADAFGKLAMSMREAGVSAQETVGIVKVVNQTLSLNGSSAGSAAAFMLQFSQAMSSGVLQGDEFRSMMENNGVFAAKLAKQLNTNIAGLRQMSKQGELTAAVLRKAIAGMQEEVSKEFAQTPMKLAGAIQTIKNAWAEIIHESNQASGSTQRMVDSFLGLRDYLERNREGIREMIAELMQAITRMVEFGVEMGKWLAQNRDTVAILLKSAAAVAALVAAVKTAALAVAGATAVIGAFKAAAVAGTVATGGLVAALAFAVTALTGVLTLQRELAQAQAEVDKSRQRGLELQERQRKMYARISEETGVLIQSHQELLQAERDGLIQWDETTRKWVAGAEARADAEEAAAEVTGKALDKLVKQYEKVVGQIRTLQDQIVGRQKSLESELRGMRREGMSDVAAWKDQRAEAEEYIEAAKKAAAAAREAEAAGDRLGAAAQWKQAVQYADDAKNAYKSLNKEVKSGDEVVISKADALKTAMQGVEEAGKLGIDILRQQQDAAKDALDALEEKSGFAGLLEKVSEAERAWLESWQRMREAGTGAVQAVDKEFTVLVQEATLVEQHWSLAADRVSKLWIQLSRDLKRELDEATKPRTVRVYTATGRSMGGLIGPERFARGGRVPGGYGGGDRVPALLESGEFVLRKEAVRHWGADLLSRLNRLVLPDFSAFLPAPALPAGPSMTLELRLPGGEAVAATVAAEDAEKLRRFNRRVSNLRFRR